MRGVFEVLPNLRRAGSTGGGEFAGPCPWCGGTDRFRLWPTHPSGHLRFWCRQCERRGDGIDLLRDLKGLTFREAAAKVGRSVVDRPPAMPANTRQEAPSRPPLDVWQSRAEKIAQEAEAALWAPVGTRALAYLQRRGLTQDTIRDARLGFVSADRRETPDAWGLPVNHRPVWIPRGIVFPWRACGALWRLNMRRPVGEPKYCGPAGSGNGLYGADGVRSGLPVVVVEGEFDALVVAQEAGDLVAVVATGSTCGARRDRWARLLRAASIILVAFDGDAAGEQATSWWLDVLSGARRLVPEGDPAEMKERGDDVRTWVRGGLSA